MNYKQFRRQARSWLSAGRKPENTAEVWRVQRDQFTRSMLAVRMFYILVMYITVNQAPGWSAWAEVEELFFIWPVAWIGWMDIQQGIGIALGFSLISSVLACVFPGLRVVRIAAFLGLLFLSALKNSLAGGIVIHGLHAYMATAFWFIFLPSGSVEHVSANRPRRMRFTQVFWYAQATLMFFYSLGGAFKCAAAVLQGSQGLSHSFSIDALSRHTANRILEGGQLSPYLSMGEIIVDYPLAGFAVFPLSIALELFGFLIVFRPAMHRIWAIGLLGMHISIFFAMSILFSGQGAILGLLFLCSPFAPNKFVFKDVLNGFPVVGDILNLMRFKKSREGAAT